MRFRLAQRRHISSLFHVYVTVGAHGILVFVIALLAVVREGGDVEVVVPLEWMRGEALVHDFVSGLEVCGRPLVSGVSRMLDRPRILDEVRRMQPRFGFVLRVEALQMAARGHVFGMLLEVSQVHLLEELVFLLARVLIARPDTVKLVG